MKKYDNLYLYESKKNAYSYVIKSEEQNQEEYGFTVTEMKNVSLQEFIGQLILDGYPSNRLEIEIDENVLSISDKKLAIQWWNTLTFMAKISIIEDYKWRYPDCNHKVDNISDTEIQTIWIYLNKPKVLVNFELANQTFNTMLNYFKHNMSVMKSNISNLELFWNKISQSSSFAHKAHKELKKLN